jgi:small nuclear ribonucleoprotein (snRNP)-like protein
MNLFISRDLEKFLCVLRDGRKLIGYLRSVDQFGTPNF